jgi:hypothetical protein
VNYDLTVTTYPAETHKIVAHKQTLDVKVGRKGYQNYLVPYSGLIAAEIVLGLTRIDGLVDVFIKTCGQANDLAGCGFDEAELASSMQNLDRFRTMKRVSKPLHWHIDA